MVPVEPIAAGELTDWYVVNFCREKKHKLKWRTSPVSPWRSKRLAAMNADNFPPLEIVSHSFPIALYPTYKDLPKIRTRVTLYDGRFTPT